MRDKVNIIAKKELHNSLGGTFYKTMGWLSSNKSVSWRKVVGEYTTLKETKLMSLKYSLVKEQKNKIIQKRQLKKIKMNIR